MNEERSGNGYKAVCCIIGLVAGFAVYFLTELPPLLPESVADGLAIAVGFAASLFVFGMTRESWGRDAVSAILIGTVSGLVFWQFKYLIGEDDNTLPDFLLAYTISGLVLLAVPMVFYQVARDEGRIAFTYAALFKISWERTIAAAIALFFFCCAWGVLFLWASLFEIIGIRFFEDLFFKTDWFRWAFGGFILGLGVALAKGRPALLQATLRIILTLFKYLSVGLSVVILLFVMALPFTGLEKFWATGFASRLLISVVFVMILFQNAVIQTSDHSKDSYGRFLSYVIMATNAILPALAVLAILALVERIGQYGFTPERYYAMVLAGLAILYSAAYALSVVVRRQLWVAGVKYSNRLLAVAVALVAIAVHLPYVNAYEISARSQASRLLNNKVALEDFDFHFLKNRLGQPGKAALNQLRETVAGAGDFIDETEAARRQRLVRTMQESMGAFAFHPARTELIEQFLDAQYVQNDDNPPHQLAHCTGQWSTGDSPVCALVQIDLTEDGLDDVILLSSLTYNQVFIQSSDGRWQDGSAIRFENGDQSLADLLVGLDRNPIEAIAPLQKDLRIGNIILRQN